MPKNVSFNLPSSLPEKTEQQNENAWKYCAHCHHKITREEWKTSVDGAYLHNFVNPLGIEFRILTFSKVVGIALHADSFWEHTWFRGFSWRIAQCQNCSSHLGWLFESDSRQETFFGIIFDQISN